MRMIKTEKNRKVYLILFMILMLQVIAAFCFCEKKTGFHYDEYYSYYSSNVTYGLVPTDREWKPQAEIVSEFVVDEGERFTFSTVARMQSYDVHPPFYYILLHAVCSLTPGIFTKWSALALNMALFAGSWILLAALTYQLTVMSLDAIQNRNGTNETAAAEKAGCCAAAGRTGNVAALGGSQRRTAFLTTALVCLLYGFCPAVLSGVMMARMYTLLGFLVLAVTYVHVLALKKRRRCRKFYAVTMLCVYLGFLTHYYYAVYMFFLAAAMEFYLLFEKAEQKIWKQKWKDCILYGIAVIGALAAAVITYPACLGHIFRGYRGTEAMGEFFNVGNTVGRIRFFAGLLNEYVFGGMLPVLLLVILLLALTAWTAGRMRRQGAPAPYWAERHRALWIVGTAVAGYFFVVTKTALLNAEEANRYPLPVYGMILMFAVIGAVLLLEKCFPRLEMKWKAALAAALSAIVLAGQIGGLLGGKVLFLYEEDEENIAFARENHDASVVHLYNGVLTWMIWDESLELMQYDEIYFVNKADLSPIADEKLAASDRVLVYAARGDDQQEALAVVQEAVGEGAEVKLLRELLYCDLYEVTK